MSVRNAGAVSPVRPKGPKGRNPPAVLVETGGVDDATGGPPDFPTAGRIPPATLRLRTSVDPGEAWPRHVDDLISRGLADLRAKAAAGDVPRKALLELLGPDVEARLAGLRDELSARVESNVFVAAHGLACDRFAAGNVADATVLLSLLVGWQTGSFDGFLGLAGIWMREGRSGEALLFVQEAMKTGVKHATAYCIAGLLELDRGDRKAGQTLLAAAARHARADPRFRDDLRIAQRALLMMHLS